MKIELTQGLYALIDDSDYDLVKKYKWHADGRPNGNKYAATTQMFKGRPTTVRMHCLIMGTVLQGRSVEIDHKDGDGLNNTRANLRKCSRNQNVWNSGPRSAGPFKGITRQSRLSYRPWQARIHRFGKTTHLGYFPTADEAAAAYNHAASTLDGEFLKLNETAAVPSDNHRRKVLNIRKGMSVFGRSTAFFELECGHVRYSPWYKRPRIGGLRLCDLCKEGIHD